MTPRLAAVAAETIEPMPADPVTIHPLEGGAYAWWEQITPDRATELLDMNTGNRNMRAQTVNAYARDMAAGKWLPTGDTIKISASGIIIDGQHRLQAIIECGIPHYSLMVGGLPIAAQTVVDTNVGRTGGDALRMAGITGGHADCLASAARIYYMWWNGYLKHMTEPARGHGRVTHTEILATVERVPDLIDAVGDAQRDMARIGIPGGPQAMTRAVLHGVDAPDAARFFESLAGYATDGPNDPRAVLLHTVRTMRATGGTQLRRPGVLVGLTFSAWNAWRDGQTLTALPTHTRGGKPLPIPYPL